MGLRITVLAQGRPAYLESMLALARGAGVRVHHADPRREHAIRLEGCDAILWDVAAAEELPPDWPRRAAPFGRAPLLVVSHAGPRGPQVERLLRAGVDDVLWLSELDPQRLVEALRKAVARARARRQSPAMGSGARIRATAAGTALPGPAVAEAGTGRAVLPTAAGEWQSPAVGEALVEPAAAVPALQAAAACGA